MKISPTSSKYGVIAALISAQNPRFENIKSDELKHPLAYPMAQEMVEKFWQKNAFDIKLEHLTTVKKVLISYLLWPSDEAFINDYGSLNIAGGLKNNENGETTLLGYYGNDGDLLFLRAEFILKEELKKALSEKEEAKALAYAEFIVQNEEYCRTFLKIPLESEEAKALAVSYLLVPSDEEFLTGVNNYNVAKSIYFDPNTAMVKNRLRYLNQEKHNFKHFAVWELAEIAAHRTHQNNLKPSSTIYMMEYPQKEMETAEQKLEIYKKRIEALEKENAKLRSQIGPNENELVATFLASSEGNTINR